MRWFLLVLAAGLLGCPTSPEPQPEPDPFDAVATLAAYLTGEFDSSQQALEDPRYFEIQLITCPVDAPELGSTVLYIEQASMDTPQQPYRQRLYVITGDDDPHVAHTEVFALANPTAAVGLCDESGTETFDEGDVVLREGCGVHVTWNDDDATFVGGTDGTACSSSLGEATYATSEVTIGADLTESWDRGWESEGVQAWGATAGPYEFVRRDGSSAADDDDASGDDDDATGSDAEVGEFHTDAADAICGAMFRCCTTQNMTDWFGGWTAQPLLEEFADTIPASEASCRTKVSEMMTVAPFGDWVAEADAGRVEYVPSAFDACIADLETAACGEEVRSALFDSECFSYSAPGDGLQRSMFRRTATVGDACSPIRDGVGSGFFGTCDSTNSFCCYDDPDCALPFDGDGNKRDGVCRQASAEGEACDAIPPVQLCQTGLTCDAWTGLCVAPLTGGLNVGDACIDDSWILLGECVDSFCDSLGDGTCQPLGGLGVSCTAPYECDSGACDGTCIENTFCVAP